MWIRKGREKQTQKGEGRKGNNEIGVIEENAGVGEKREKRRRGREKKTVDRSRLEQRIR